MILFGAAGIPICAKGKGIADGIREVKRLGLDAIKVEFVRGVRMDGATARKAWAPGRSRTCTCTPPGSSGRPRTSAGT